MHWSLLLFTALFIKTLVGQRPPATDQGKTSFYSDSYTSFYLHLARDSVAQRLLSDSIIFGSGCQLSLTETGGRPALAIKTSQEFSDAFIKLEHLYGYPVDVSQARYLSLSLYVPDSSWISAMKFNFKDSLGNFGGANEVFNNFYGHYNRWIDVVVDIQTLLPDFKNWTGNSSPLPRVSLLSFNPYNAHQADSSVIYVNNLRLSDEKPDAQYTRALAPRPRQEPNIPYEINFDNLKRLRTQTAYRSFESSYQALASGVAGNETRAIRLKGNEVNEHIAFLPMLDKLTGKPVDFTRVSRIYFSYYLTEDSDDFDGSWLSLVSQHWQDILIAKDFYSDYQKGAWHRVSIPLDSLNFEQVRGQNDVLPQVYELRLDLNYLPGQKNIEMWIDDFGWE